MKECPLPDAHKALSRALIARTEGVSIGAAESAGWASVTFTGARHRFVLTMPADAEPGFSRNLDCDEFHLPGHVLADIVQAERTIANNIVTLTIEALTVEER